MSYMVRHQIFVSSTFTDLVEERAEVLQALWELDCIPTGMEAFVASNESQWQVIKRVIDECDYYVLILGGRYGTVTPDGVSYTEKEYLYAKELGIPVLAFVHADPQAIPVAKSELDEAGRSRLDDFRAKVMADHPVRKWSNPQELGGLVSRSVVREIRINPRPGWIRNDGTSPIALLEQVNKLTEENRTLRDAAHLSESVVIDPDLQSGADKMVIDGTWRVYSSEHLTTIEEVWETTTTWDIVFQDLGPILINEASENEIKDILSRFHLLTKNAEGNVGNYASVSPECWSETLIQYRALGYMEPGVKKRGVNDRHKYWRITPRGDKHLVSLMAKKKTG
ncbi:MAG TPA: DUF4062 domain-containing protein [Brevundimonas sp.]